jgi:hypothetical protein
VLGTDIYRVMNSVWNKEELPQQWKESLKVTICKNDMKMIVNNYMAI